MADGYEPLRAVLQTALHQAQAGKGRDRHATPGQPFTAQPILTITRSVGVGFPLGQAAKKIDEAARLPPSRAVPELLGAIVYLAAAVIRLEELDENGPESR